MGSLFSRPHATALFVVDGASQGLSLPLPLPLPLSLSLIFPIYFPIRIISAVL